MNIIPKPLKLEEKVGNISWSKNTLPNGDFCNIIEKARLYFDKLPEGSNNELIFKKDENLADEEYTIYCYDNNIEVKASKESGALYAFETLLQLADGKNFIPKVSISDKPRYQWRGFMLDCARHFWSIEYIKSILDFMASIKLNKFHWHLSEDQGWRAEIKKYPLLTQKGSIRRSTELNCGDYYKGLELHEHKEYGKDFYYTQNDMKEIVKYASERNIDVIPEIDMPGHLVSAIACYPELSCEKKPLQVSNRWGVMDDIGCCGSEEIYTFAKDVIDELVEIFPYEYFHIGGDEVPKDKWKVCPKCQAKIRELNLATENDLQGYFNNEMAKHLKSKGKNMIGWNEVLDTKNLDTNIVAQWWMNHKKDKNELDWAKKGGKFVLSLNSYVYLDHPYGIRPLEKTYNYSYSDMGLKNDDCVLGFEAPQWTEYVRDADKFALNTFVRLLAISEISWTSKENKNYKNFEQRVELLRDYFSKMNIFIAPKEIYDGTALKKYNKSYKKAHHFWELWKNNPNYEQILLEKLNK